MITKIFIIICIVLFLMIKSNEKYSSKQELAIRYGALYPPKIIYEKEYWRFVNANVIHLDFMHIFMNLYAIYYLGDFFETLLKVDGYLLLMGCSGFMASYLTYQLAKRDNRYMHTITLGASGIFYGYLGAMIALAILFGGNFVYLLQRYSYIIVINIGFTFLNRNISKTGHIGGMIGGFLAILIIYLLIHAGLY